MKLKGKIVIVTGASRGIGFAISKLLSEHGAIVVMTSKDLKKLKDASKKVSGSLPIVCNIRKSEQVKNVIKQTVEKFGKIDILINNAGIFPFVKPLHEIEEKEWDNVIDINLTGQYRFTKYAIPYLKKTNGTIINMSSDAGLKAYPGFEVDAYSATKAALILLTKCWALEYAKYKIRVNCICPGVVDTDMTAPFLKNQKDRDMMDHEHPIGRIGKPEDIANAVLYLVSDDASWVTGSILTVDGGESLK